MVADTTKQYAKQSVFKQFVGHPQAALSDLSRPVFSNDDVTQSLGPLIFECKTRRSAPDVKFSNLVAAFFVGIAIAVFTSIAIAFLSIWLGLLEKHLAAFVVLGGSVVLTPFGMVLMYWLGERQYSGCRFDLHQRGIRYVNLYWQAKDIVAINAGSSVQGLDERPNLSARIFFFLKPSVRRGLQENRDDTIHLELSDGTKPNLIIALSVFQEAGVAQLLSETAKTHPTIRMDPALAERLCADE